MLKNRTVEVPIPDGSEAREKVEWELMRWFWICDVCEENMCQKNKYSDKMEK